GESGLDAPAPVVVAAEGVGPASGTPSRKPRGWSTGSAVNCAAGTPTKAESAALPASLAQRSSDVHGLKSPSGFEHGEPMFAGLHMPVPASQVSHPEMVLHLSPTSQLPVAGLQNDTLHGSLGGSPFFGSPGTQKLKLKPGMSVFMQ